MHNLIIYGGTFDPIHKGHINTAINVQNQFNFERFVFLPCKIPALKKNAVATPLQRITMLELALVNQHHNFAIDLSEINRDTPSYMVDTLKNFRIKLGQQIAITLLMGRDNFNQLHHWHAWQELITLANLLVINRPGMTDKPSPLLKELLLKNETHDAQAILKYSHGSIYHYDAGYFPISSSLIRKKLAKDDDLTPYLTASVLEYIRKNGLYQTTKFSKS